MSRLARKIKEFRKKLNLTQVELAKLLELTPGAIANYEVGIRVPKLSVINHILMIAKDHHIGLCLDDFVERK